MPGAWDRLFFCTMLLDETFFATIRKGKCLPQLFDSIFSDSATARTVSLIMLYQESKSYFFLGYWYLFLFQCRQQFQGGFPGVFY